jgi:pimeloyl-ACP methyl ester carboxylesterase
LVGHDWGAIAAWYVAMNTESCVDKLIVMNVPHPQCYMENLNLNKVLKSWYIWILHYLNYLSGMLKQKILSGLPIIQAPTLMLWRENDPYTSKNTTQGTDKYVKNLELKFLSNCSHWTQQDCPKEVNQLMSDFLLYDTQHHII